MGRHLAYGKPVHAKRMTHPLQKNLHTLIKHSFCLSMPHSCAVLHLCHLHNSGVIGPRELAQNQQTQLQRCAKLTEVFFKQPQVLQSHIAQNAASFRAVLLRAPQAVRPALKWFTLSL